MVNRKYLVSAIVSVYNCERFIAGCLEDLEQQTIADKLEIVVVNTGSQQNEEAIIKKFQEGFDNIVYIKTENRETIYQAWNRGVKASSGKYITNANSDDRHRKDAFEIMSKVLESNKDVDLVYADYIITEMENETFDNHTGFKKLTLPEFDNYKLLQYCFIGPQPMWRKSLHSGFGYFDESLKVAGDYEYWLRISKHSNLKHIDECLGLYLKSPDSAEHINNAVTISETISVRGKYMKTAVLDKKLMTALKYIQSDELSNLAEIYLDRKNLALAGKTFLSSLVYNFHNLYSLKGLIICFIPRPIINTIRKVRNNCLNLSCDKG